jgi:hypothetical protein
MSVFQWSATRRNQSVVLKQTHRIWTWKNASVSGEPIMVYQEVSVLKMGINKNSCSKKTAAFEPEYIKWTETILGDDWAEMQGGF